MSSHYQIFVYGSLRKGFEHPAYQYVGHYFHFIGHGKVKGLLYDLGEYPAAVPTDEEKFIIGEVYAIKNPDEFSYAIAQLDDYEGVNQEDGTSLYRRELEKIYLENGEQLDAWIYWYNEPIAGHPVVTSGDVLAYLAEKKRAK